MSLASPAFVGRDAPLALVTNAIQERPALVLIEGEPGIGKTRLLYEAGAIRRDGFTLLAASPPLREPLGLGAVVDGLRRVCSRDQVPNLSPLGGALRPLLPEWSEMLPPALEALDDPKQTRHRLLRALSELVERLAVETLVIEDAQWADTATLEWLMTLCVAGDPKLAVVVTYRPHDVPDGSSLFRLTSRAQPGWTRTRIELGPLDIDDIRRLVGSMLGTDDVSDKFAAFLHRHTDGNPLAVEETVRLMRDRREIFRKDGVWSRRMLDDVDVPPTVRDSVLERIDRLDHDTRQVLRAAATLAAPADAETLAAVAGLDGQAGSQGVAAGLAAGLLREADSGNLEFRHSLDARAVAEVTPVSVQWALHRRAAQCLQNLDPQPVTRLAGHFRKAHDVEAWCHYAEESAAMALESGDDHTAVVTLLDLLTSAEHPVERRTRLARKLGEVAFFGAAALGELTDGVVTTLRDVLSTGGLPAPERGELRLQFGRMLWRAGHELAAIEEFSAAIPDLDHRPDLAARAMANLAVPVNPDWPAEEHVRWLDRATAIVDQSGSRLDQLALAVNRATALLLLGEDAGWRVIDEISESASDLGEQRMVALGLINVAEASLAWGRYDETRKQLDAALEYIQIVDYQRFVTTERVLEAYLDWYRGAWSGLYETAAELTASDDTEPAYRLRARHIQALLDLAVAGRSAEPQLRDAVDECTRRGIAEPEVTVTTGALARMLLIDGDAGDALTVTRPVVDVIARKGVWLWATDIAIPHVEALTKAAGLDTAQAWVEQFATGLAGRDAPAPAAAVATCRAVVAESQRAYADAADLFEEAAHQWAALMRPYDELLTRERLGRCLLASGDPSGEGVTTLSDAEQRLRDLGAKWDADRVARTLRENGVEVTRTWRRGPVGYGDQLSPRERECLELVAQGMTNKSVAKRLFLSPRTVERHLRSAMRKLRVSSRTALVTAAIDKSLLPTTSDHDVARDQ